MTKHPCPDCERLRAENLIREGERMKTLARMALELEQLRRALNNRNSEFSGVNGLPHH